jgi:hypothetical protein
MGANVKKRAAVVIGVNKTGGSLPVLEACATGATEVAGWLGREGFDVTALIDGDGKLVTCKMVQDAIAHYVKPGKYHQLVIFFSGHGYWKNETELWLLSNAPADANEAISWIETAEYAKDCGIPNVVLISDACRTIPTTKSAVRVRGSVVFPNVDTAGTRSKVDKFMAAAVAQAAYETNLDPTGKKTSVFTHCLLRAFRNPDPDTVDKVTEDGEVKFVVPNRKLGVSLQRWVPEILSSIKATYVQEPDAEVLSDNDAYIGRAQRPPSGAHPELGPAPKPSANLREVAEVAVSKELGTGIKLSPRRLKRLESLAKDSGFELNVRTAGQTADITHFETETGFVIVGASVVDAAGSMGAEVDVLEPGNMHVPGVVRVRLKGRASSVGFRFANGRGTVLAALFGYLAHVIVENDGVVSVSYVPSRNSFRWHSYSERRVTIDRLRAVTNAAARSGVFRLPSESEAITFAASARIEKGIDPSLGLYASYAYSQADRRDSIDSVLDYMRSDLEVDLYDVALLARQPTTNAVSAWPVVPFCPMLTQGWNLLRSRNVTLTPVLNDAQDDLEPTLWTTFKEGSAIAVLEDIRKGELQ